MPVVVHVLPAEEYDAWLAGQTAGVTVQPAVLTDDAAEVRAASATPVSAEWTMGRAMSEGEGLYNANCGACHQANGQGLPPTFPAIAGSAVATGDLAAHVDIAVHGKPGTAMAAFGPQLSDEALAAIVTYQRNAFGNDTGDLVTPDQIAAVR